MTWVIGLVLNNHNNKCILPQSGHCICSNNRTFLEFPWEGLLPTQGNESSLHIDGSVPDCLTLSPCILHWASPSRLTLLFWSVSLTIHESVSKLTLSLDPYGICKQKLPGTKSIFSHKLNPNRRSKRKILLLHQSNYLLNSVFLNALDFPNVTDFLLEPHLPWLTHWSQWYRLGLSLISLLVFSRKVLEFLNLNYHYLTAKPRVLTLYIRLLSCCISSFFIGTLQVII